MSCWCRPTERAPSTNPLLWLPILRSEFGLTGSDAIGITLAVVSSSTIGVNELARGAVSEASRKLIMLLYVVDRRRLHGDGTVAEPQVPFHIMRSWWFERLGMGWVKTWSLRPLWCRQERSSLLRQLAGSCLRPAVQHQAKKKLNM